MDRDLARLRAQQRVALARGDVAAAVILAARISPAPEPAPSATDRDAENRAAFRGLVAAYATAAAILATAVLVHVLAGWQ